jgi:quercetin dioxygenase-like cupin family protein
MSVSMHCSLTTRFLPRFAVAAVAVGFAAPLALADHHAFVQTADSPQLEWGPCPEFMPQGCAIAVLQGNPAEPNADVLFKLPAGTTAPEHWHTSAERMVLIAGEMEVQYEGQQPETLRGGTYAYGPAELSHHATCNSDEDCVLFIAFEEPVDAFATEE